VRLRRAKGGLGNAALRASGTARAAGEVEGAHARDGDHRAGCGSDPSKVQTTAVLDGDEWVINGEKIFVDDRLQGRGRRGVGDDRQVGRPRGIKSFLIEKGTPGFVVAHKEKKLGIRADDTAAYVFKDCRIPRANLLGGDETIPKAELGRLQGRAQDLQHDARRPSPRADSAWHRLRSTSHATSCARRASRSSTARARTASRRWSRSSSSSNRCSRPPS
jgi:alkylation response protein AidB-like acyl-CoA dehydrogenase